MSAEFFIHKSRGWLGVAVAIGFGVICLFTAPGAPGLWAPFATLFGVGCLMAAVYSARWLFHKGPILVISAEGLYYAPFADRATPWNEITAFTRILSFGRSQILNKVTWTRAPNADQLNFDVSDLRAYPNGPFRALASALQRIGGIPPIIIQLGMLDASADVVVAEIKKYWRGYMAEYDPRPVHQR